jgi:Lrp/AsnC family transcriptional regulator, leucine-responsive regulatory protein
MRKSASGAGLSAPAVYERIRRVEHEGSHPKTHDSIRSSRSRLALCAFIRLGTAGDHRCDAIAANLAANPKIDECHSIVGEDTLLIKVHTPSPIDLENLIKRIRSITGIVTTVTTVVLMTHFERGLRIPLAESDAIAAAQPSAGLRYRARTLEHMGSFVH